MNFAEEVQKLIDAEVVKAYDLGYKDGKANNNRYGDAIGKALTAAYAKPADVPINPAYETEEMRAGNKGSVCRCQQCQQGPR